MPHSRDMEVEEEPGGGRQNFKSGGTNITAMKRAENFLGLYPPHMPFWEGGTPVTKKGIRRAYRTALLQCLTGRAHALIGLHKI